ncbi:MAG: aspartate-semialdehyde dehydrogenase [Flavobacteriales bacterium]|nr:aspartate-semialdehyde dehydrogenase [Flavobacteriales bacterium]MDG1396377.1 aspartate-semialdehyde dehydrogenase [Flavobacteriales bacterium]
MKVAVIGATGMVGTVMLKVLAERKFPVTELIPVASKTSVGKTISWQDKDYRVHSLEEALLKKPDLALFSAGSACSLAWAPKFAAVGTSVVDNSSAWRMKVGHKLIVPEINANELTAADKIIANPNCSTIQMVLALNPLHKRYGLERIIVSTYQSITGTGVKAMQQLQNEEQGLQGAMAYPYPIYRNCLPHCDDFTSTGYTKEEMKLVHETRKIIGDKNIGITATAVRVPVMGGHSESINITFKNDFDMRTVRTTLHEADGLVLQDNTEMNTYPMPKYAAGKDAVFVGRLRRDASFKNTLNMWVVSDNLRKGAATNAVQIAECLLKKGFIH